MDKLLENKILKCLENPKNKNKVIKFLQEIEEENEKNKTEIDKKHDKLFKEISMDREEASIAIRTIFGVYIKPKDIIICNCEFRTGRNKKLEVDVLYRIKGTNQFFLIEYQTKVDKYMVYRILNYQVEIINRYRPKIRENKEAPLVMAAVIFTGKGKSTAKTKLAELQKDIKNGIELIFGNEKNLGNYIVIDIKDLNMKKLFESESVLEKAYIFEQSKSAEELIKNIYLSYKKIPLKRRELFEKAVRIILSGKISDNKIDEIIEDLRTKGGDNMSTMVQQMLANEIRMHERRGQNRGRKLGIIQSAKGLLRNNVSEDIIINSIGITKKELQKIKESIK